MAAVLWGTEPDEHDYPAAEDYLALLATPHPEEHRKQLEKAKISDRRIAQLEQAIDDCEQELEPLKAFIMPGGTPKAASLHVARTVCRRAERSIVALGGDAVEPELLIYINRLSDLLFVMARAVNRRAGAPELEW